MTTPRTHSYTKVKTMRLEELTQGTPLTLMVKIGTESLQFPSKVIDAFPKKHFILAEPVLREEKLLSFRGKDVSVDLLVLPPDSKPLLFAQVKITGVRLADSFAYSITSREEGVICNRRANFRCYIGLPSSLRYGIPPQDYEVIIKDISYSGFAIVCDPTVELQENELIHLLLEDAIEGDAQEYSFMLTGIVVRSQDMENGRILYGCKINNPLPGLEQYVMKKERQTLRKIRDKR